jgi:hypothetical protein
MKEIIADFVKFASEHEEVIPDYVKSASVHTFANLDDPKNKAEVFLAAFAKRAGHKLMVVNRDLHKRASLFGIEHQLAAMIRALDAPPPVKTAAAEEPYPIRSLIEWRKAAAWLEQNGYALPITERRKIANCIVKKAAEFGQETGVSLEAMAGLGQYNAYTVIENLVKRAAILRNTHIPNKPYRERWLKTARALDELAESIAYQPCTSEQFADKIAQTVQIMDNDFNLYQRYGYDLHPPDIMVRSVSDSTRRDIDRYSVKLADGTVYDRRDFNRIPAVKLARYFGEDAVWDMMTDLRLDTDKIASVAEKWELPETQVFRDLLNEQGIEPKVFTSNSLLGKQFIETLAHYE